MSAVLFRARTRASRYPSSLDVVCQTIIPPIALLEPGNFCPVFEILHEPHEDAVGDTSNSVPHIAAEATGANQIVPANIHPIVGLTTELLELIFEAGFSLTPEESKATWTDIVCSFSFRNSVARVCQHWRNVAIQMPMLWGRLHIHLKHHVLQPDSSNTDLQWIDTYIRRSRGYPLDLIIDEQWGWPGLILLKISPYSQRWRSLILNLSLVDSESLRRLGSHLQHLPVPLLEKLELRSGRYGTPRVGWPHSIPIFPGGASRLTHLALDHMPLMWNSFPLPFQTLTTLELSFASWPTYKQLLDIMATSCLNTLVIHDDFNRLLSDVTQGDRPSILMPTLRRLELHNYGRSGYSGASGIFQLLSIPSLDTLFVADISAAELDLLVMRLRGNAVHYPSLRVLSLRDIDGSFNVRTVTAIAVALPMLAELSLVRLLAASFLRALQMEETRGLVKMPVWPCMKTLGVGGWNLCISMPLVNQAVTARSSMQRPLHRLVLDDAFFVNPERLRRLQEHVEVDKLRL